MIDLTTNTTAFGLMEPEDQDRLRKAELAGTVVLIYTGNNYNWLEKYPRGDFVALCIYRLAAEPFNMSKEQWSHYDDEWICMAYGEYYAFPYIYNSEPNFSEDFGVWRGASFISLKGVRGVPRNGSVPWQSSLVWRKDAK